MLNRGGVNASPAAFYFVNENKPENLAAATTRKFLGVKLECIPNVTPIRSPRWTRDQFWEFAAFFAGMQPQRPGLQPVSINNSRPRQIKNSSNVQDSEGEISERQRAHVQGQ